MPRGDSLIFDWPGRHTLHIVLPSCIILAVLAHAGLFYLFTIIYPRPEPAGPSPEVVYFIPPQSADHARLAEILQTDDPAIFAPGRGIAHSEFRPASRYTPGYETEKAALDPLPGVPETSVAKEAQAAPVSLTGSRPPSVSQPEPPPTQLVAGEPLAARLPRLPEQAGFEALPGQSLEPAGFLVSVRADGSVAHVLPQHPSGNAQIDARALKLLSSLRFLPSPGGENAWGEVTFYWGSDVRRPAEAQ